MMIQIHSDSVPYLEFKSKRVFRVKANKCSLEANWFGSDCMDSAQKENFEALPVSLCILSKFDEKALINESYSEFYDYYIKDPEELFGVIKYIQGEQPSVKVTMLVDQRGLNLCRYGAEKISSGYSPGFILHVSTNPDLRWDSRNPPFDYNDFIGGKHYFIEYLNYQILKSG